MSVIKEAKYNRMVLLETKTDETIIVPVENILAIQESIFPESYTKVILKGFKEPVSLNLTSEIILNRISEAKDYLVD